MSVVKLPNTIACIVAAASCVHAAGRDAFHWSGKLKRGINISCALEAPEEGKWGVVIREEHFDTIKAAGFDSVRLPVRWNTHAGSKPPYAVDPAFFDRVDQVLRWGLDRDLVMVLDWHHYVEFINEDPKGHSGRFFAIWKQLAAHYRNWPPELYFEILNEPAKKLTAELWNQYQPEALRIIRKTNPDRAVVVGPVAHSKIEQLKHLRLPESDRNLIVTFHMYEPHHFTHQGVKENPTGIKWGYPHQRERLAGLVAQAAAYRKVSNRPVWMGEFGTSTYVPSEQRAKWAAFVRGEAERHGIPWAYWSFYSKKFGAYNLDTKRWNERLLEALFSPNPAEVVEKTHAPDRIDRQAAERHISGNFADLAGGLEWQSPGKKKDLSDTTAASARIEISVDANSRGVIIEAGAEVCGLALYIESGGLYFQCGNGVSFGAPLQAVCKTEIAPGRHVVLWSADMDRGLVILAIDGKKEAEFSGSFGPKLAGPDTGRLGGVHGGIPRNAGNFTKGNGSFTGTIHACTVWPGRSIFEKGREDSMKFDSFGGRTAIRGKATGFFHLEEIDGRHFLVTPAGHGYRALGINHFHMMTSKNYDGAIRNIRKWGFNAGCYQGPKWMWKRYPYTKGINLAPVCQWMPDRQFGFKDVFDPEYLARMEEKIRKIVEPQSGNAMLIGYFWTDIPLWTRKRDGRDWLSFYKSLPADSAGGKVWRNWKVVNPRAPEKAFLTVLARQLYANAHQFIRRYDSNHLIFGDRYHEIDMPDMVVREALPYVDAIAIQPTSREFNQTFFDKIYQKYGKPIYIADHVSSFATKKHPVTMGQTAKDAESYVAYYERYVTSALSHPYMVGYNKCQYQDQTIRNMLKQGLLQHNEEPYSTVPGISAANRKALDHAYSGVAKENSAVPLSKAEIMAGRIGRGINVDVSLPEGGSPVKVLYDPAQYDAVKAAGFRSVRFFVSAGRDPAIYKARIVDALDRGLAVVICMWGNRQWTSKPREGIQQFAGAWNRLATYYRDYPEDVVFELWNEPAGLVIQPEGTQGIEDGKTVMEYLNAALPVIRKTNPHRTLALGGPGYNGRRELEEFVTSEYLTYRLEDGTGFDDDRNIIGVFHMYHPHRFTHWTAGLEAVPGWKDEVLKQMSHPIAWAKRWQRPVLLSEFGAWVPPCHTVEDYKTYIRFVVDECRKHNIGWMYYTAGFNNQWAFNILHTEDGWNQDALDILTGITAPPPPPMSPLINTEFSGGTDNWTSEGSITVSVDSNAGLSGSSTLKIEATKSARAEVYQETPEGKGSPPGRFLISVRRGRLYRITFLARSLDGAGTLQVRLSDVSGSADGFWTSKPVAISTTAKEYAVEYRHTGPDVDDVRLAFLFGDQDQAILLDRIALRGYRE